MKRNFINVEVSEDEKLDILIEARKIQKISVSDYVRRKLFAPEQEKPATAEIEKLKVEIEQLKSEATELKATHEKEVKEFDEIKNDYEVRLQEKSNEVGRAKKIFEKMTKIEAENKQLQSENTRLQNEITDLKPKEIENKEAESKSFFHRSRERRAQFEAELEQKRREREEK